MTAKRLALVLVMLVLVISAGKPLSALCMVNGQVVSCGCVCFGGGMTGTYTGSGSTCTQARWAAELQAAPEVNCESGICRQTYVASVACYWDNAAGVYKESGRIRFHCYLCE